jgi:hypothetical protein
MGKMRSPNYPSIGLSEGIKAIQQIWDKEKRTAVPIDVLGKAMGYTSVSGPVRTKVAALRKYGLLEQSGGNYKISELGMQILHSMPESQERRDAINIAAMRPESVRELYETHADASDEALKSYLLVRKSFSEAGAKQFIKAFRDTLSIANPSQSGYTPDEAADIAEADEMEQSLSESKEVVSYRKRNPNVRSLNVSSEPRKTFTWPLSKGVTAEVRFTGGEVQPSHLDLLAKYLELAKSAIETEDDRAE